MKPLVVHREAREELDEAIGWYNDREEGLGLGLHDEVEAALAEIQRDPGIGVRYRNTSYRFYRVRRFPYVIYYLELDAALWISAIAHERRRPGYWRKRKP